MKEDNIFYEIKSLEKTIMKKFCFVSEVSDFNHIKPSATQHQIIVYLIEHSKEDVYQKDLEKVLNLTRATVSGVLQTMEKNKLIKRVTSNVDTRTKRVILNKDAESVFAKGKSKFLELERNATQGISKKELIMFSKVLNRMKDNINNE